MSLSTLEHPVLDETQFVDGCRRALAAEAAAGRSKYSPSDLTFDHATYRCATMESYKAAKNALVDSETHAFFYESIVRGRPIALFERRVPVECGEWKLDFIEVCSPRENEPCLEGWEHIEVIPLGPKSGTRETRVRTHVGLVKIHSVALRETIRLERADRGR